VGGLGVCGWAGWVCGCGLVGGWTGWVCVGGWVFLQIAFSLMRGIFITVLWINIFPFS
jgi:hypothetical protein